MATQVAVEALKFVPTVGSLLSALLQLADKFYKQRKEVESKIKKLKEILSVWSSELKQSELDNPGTGKLVKDLQVTVNGFKDYVEQWDLPKHSIFSQAYREFTDRFQEFQNELTNMMYRMMVEILQTVTATKDGVHMLDKKLQSMRNLINIRESTGDDKERVLKKEWRDALENFKSKNNELKIEAQHTLLEWLEHGIDQRHAIEVSQVLIQEGNEEARTVGLGILTKMTADSEMRKKILQSDATLVTLLDVARGQPSDAIRKDAASECLANLMQEPAIFFEKWEQTQRAITSEDLIERIVLKSSTDKQALGVLAKLATMDECKSAIANKGGVSMLAEIYMKTDKMSTAGIDPTVIVVIDALASLSTNADCRTKFADGRHIWPLLHFIRSCTKLSTETISFVNDWDNAVEKDEDGNDLYERHYRTETTKFGEIRAKECITCEENAGRALWELSLDTRCERAFLELGAFEKLLEEPLARVPILLRNKYKSFTPYRAIRGWLKMASRVRKGTKKWGFIEKKFSIKTETDVWFLQIAWNLLCNPETMLAVAVSYCGYPDPEFSALTTLLFGKRADPEQLDTFCRVSLPLDSTCLQKVKSLLNDGDSAQTKKALGDLWLCAWLTIIGERFKTIDDNHANSLVESCEDLTSPGHEVEHFWAACLLLSMLASERPSWNVSHTRIVKLAARSVIVLMNEDGRTFRLLAKHLLCMSKPSGMDSSHESLDNYYISSDDEQDSSSDGYTSDDDLSFEDIINQLAGL